MRRLWQRCPTVAGGFRTCSWRVRCHPPSVDAAGPPATVLATASCSRTLDRGPGRRRGSRPLALRWPAASRPGLLLVPHPGGGALQVGAHDLDGLVDLAVPHRLDEGQVLLRAPAAHLRRGLLGLLQ